MGRKLPSIRDWRTPLARVGRLTRMAIGEARRAQGLLHERPRPEMDAVLHHARCCGEVLERIRDHHLGRYQFQKWIAATAEFDRELVGAYIHISRVALTIKPVARLLGAMMVKDCNLYD